MNLLARDVDLDLHGLVVLGELAVLTLVDEFGQHLVALGASVLDQPLQETGRTDSAGLFRKLEFPGLGENELALAVLEGSLNEHLASGRPLAA